MTSRSNVLVEFTDLEAKLVWEVLDFETFEAQYRQKFKMKAVLTKKQVADLTSVRIKLEKARRIEEVEDE